MFRNTIVQQRMFRISDRYLFFQVLKATVYAVVALSLFIVLGQIFQEIRPLLVENRVPLPLVGKFVLNVFPKSLMFTIPWGFMAAVMLVFGRLSAENELNALQLAGLSLPRIALPVIILGALLSSMCLWINTSIVPRANSRIDNVVYDAVERNPKDLIKPGMITSQIENLRIFVQSKDEKKLQSLHIYRLPDPKKNTANTGYEYVYAEDAGLGVDSAKKQIKLTMNSAYIESTGKNQELQIILASAAPWKYDLLREKKFRASSMTEQEIRAYLSHPPPEFKPKNIPKFHAAIIQRYTFAMATFCFAFIAIPLSLARRRRDSTSGIILALLLGAGYFIFTLVAQKSGDADKAMIILWSPNLLCILIGIYLFHRVRFR